MVGTSRAAGRSRCDVAAVRRSLWGYPNAAKMLLIRVGHFLAWFSLHPLLTVVAEDLQLFPTFVRIKNDCFRVQAPEMRVLQHAWSGRSASPFVEVRLAFSVVRTADDQILTV